MDNLSEWLNLLVRWFHIFAGILWIGSTWYFTWLDRQLHASAGAGVLMVHSGGFYKVEKLRDTRVDPSRIHWFRFEALLTWLSGLLLLVVVYYAGGLMTDGALAPPAAIAVGVGSLVAAWVIYDLVWITPLGRNALVGGAVCWLLLIAAGWKLTALVGGRAAYIHLGAMMGTVMVLNVWMRILPAQKKLVAAVARGDAPDPALAERAKNRSKHNTFIILPVVMTMISNHFPTATYGSERPWLVFAALSLVGFAAAAMVRSR